MRLIEIKQKINKAFELYNLKIIQLNGGNIKIEKAQDIRQAISLLNEIKMLPFEDPYTFIQTIHSDNVIVDPSKHPGIVEKLKHLDFTLKILKDWYQDYIPNDEDPYEVDIKLPQTNKMDELTKSCIMINKSLSQVVSEIGGILTFKRMEYGSSWIAVGVGTLLASKLVMSIADAAFNLVKKYCNFKIVQQAYERYSMGTDMMRQIKEANEAILKQDMSLLAEKIDQEYYTEQDHERVQRIRVSIQEMYKLIELGGEIHPSLLLQDAKDDKIDYKELLMLKKQELLPRNEEDVQE